MSYDLKFYKKKGTGLSKTDIITYLETLPNIVREGETQWHYQNEDTGVYCLFEYHDDNGSPDETEQEEFGEFEDTGFGFNINFVRPQYFGTECFRLVDGLLEALDVYIVNYQGEAVPLKYEKGVLEQQWGNSNMSFARKFYQEWDLNYLDMQRSTYTWLYSMNRKTLQSQLGEDYFVPGIYYIRKPGSNIVETFCVWPEHIPCVLPDVDLVFIHKKIKKLFGTKEENGLIRYADLVRHLGGFFEKRGDYLMLHPEQAEKMTKSFNDLPLLSSIEKYGDPITADKIVNVKGE